jgi:hypothetical protein
MNNHTDQEETQIQQEQEETPIKVRYNHYLIAGTILAIALIMVGATRGNKSDTQRQNQDQNDIVVTIDDSPTATQINTTNLTEGYSTDTFDDLEQATKFINSWQDKPTQGPGAENILAMVVDGKERHQVYFATETFDLETRDVFNAIYSYDTLSNNWERIYKKTFLGQDGVDTQYLRVVARVDDKLILFTDNKANSPGECASFWLMADRDGFELLQMDLNNPYAELVSIDPSAEQKAIALEQQKTCSAGL